MTRPEREDDPKRRALQTAYRLLALRGRSSAELAGKLRGKGFSDDLIAQILETCRTQGYLDDAAFLAGRIRYLGRERHYGNARIERDLLQKGFSREDVREALARYRQDAPEEESLAHLIRKMIQKAPPEDSDRLAWRRRVFARLQGRGFAPGAIWAALKHIEEETRHGVDGQ